MTAREKMELLAWVTCTVAAVLVIMLLSPGVYELKERAAGALRRGRVGMREGVHQLKGENSGRVAMGYRDPKVADQAHNGDADSTTQEIAR